MFIAAVVVGLVGSILRSDLPEVVVVPTFGPALGSCRDCEETACGVAKIVGSSVELQPPILVNKIIYLTDL